VVGQRGTFADGGAVLDDRERADLDVVGNVGVGTDDCLGMNLQRSVL